MIKFKSKGDFKKTRSFLSSLYRCDYEDILDKYGVEGVNALKANTPVDTGVTANSWSYDIIKTKNRLVIRFNNSNIQNGALVAIILQYGHATRNGGWVDGIDYINPAIAPIFNRLADEAWREVTNV